MTIVDFFIQKKVFQFALKDFCDIILLLLFK